MSTTSYPTVAMADEVEICPSPESLPHELVPSTEELLPFARAHLPQLLCPYLPVDWDLSARPLPPNIVEVETIGFIRVRNHGLREEDLLLASGSYGCYVCNGTPQRNKSGLKRICARYVSHHCAKAAQVGDPSTYYNAFFVFIPVQHWELLGDRKPGHSAWARTTQEDKAIYGPEFESAVLSWLFPQAPGIPAASDVAKKWPRPSIKDRFAATRHKGYDKAKDPAPPPSQFSMSVLQTPAGGSMHAMLPTAEIDANACAGPSTTVGSSSVSKRTIELPASPVNMAFSVTTDAVGHDVDDVIEGLNSLITRLSLGGDLYEGGPECAPEIVTATTVLATATDAALEAIAVYISERPSPSV